MGSAGSAAYRGEPQPRPENLLGDSQTPALLDTGDRITTAQARQLAREAANIPMVLGGKSKTNLAEGRLLCPATQRPVAEYEMKTIPNERVVFSGT